MQSVQSPSEVVQRCSHPPQRCSVTSKFDSARGRAAGKRSAAVRKATAAEQKVRAAPRYFLAKRWPVAPDIIEFCTHPDLLNLTLSEAQEALLRAIYGLHLSEPQLALFRACTGRGAYPAAPFAEVTVIVGARGG